ncbi:MAG: gliding motility-associated C-terminal domain-containing protein [Candidatus Latescibacteria bacterium]|nr:gliding motility-associated C-terminal domain-containing protein [Candidatus Latescibacterota bacterium]
MESFFKKALLFLFALLVIPGEASSKVTIWSVGGAKHPWTAVGAMTSMDDVTFPGAIQPKETDPEENIAAALNWKVGRPKTYEEGVPCIWHNDPYGLEERNPIILVDGDGTTSTGEWYKETGVSQVGRTFYIDLGTPYSLSRIVFYPRQEGEDEEGRAYKDDYPKGYELFVNDGDMEKFVEGEPVYRMLRSNRRNRDAIVDIRFSLRPIRFIKLRIAAPQPFEIAEIELYGKGFATTATYLSNPIDLGNKSNFGKLYWSATKWRRLGPEGDLVPEPEASVSIKVETKSGTDDTPLVYRVLVGAPGQQEIVVVDEAAYNKAKKTGYYSGKKCEVLPVVEDRENWSLWSRPLSAPGQQIISAAPRRYFQFRLIIQSQSIWEMARVDSLWFQKCAPPVADSLLAEIAVSSDPTAEASVVKGGARTSFTYDLRPVNLHTGFNALEITTPTEATFEKLEMGDPLQEVNPDSISVTADKLTVYFPHIDKANPVPLRLQFNVPVLAFGTIFYGKVFDTQSEDLPQFVVPGDANDDVSTNSLKVLISEKSLGEVITSVSVLPKVMSPNDDGINEHADISYTILQLTDKGRVKIAIFDLGGVLVKTTYEGQETKGRYRHILWDGTDSEGRLMPPGAYIYRISIDTAEDSFSKSGMISLVY